MRYFISFSFGGTISNIIITSNKVINSSDDITFVEKKIKEQIIKEKAFHNAEKYTATIINFQKLED